MITHEELCRRLNYDPQTGIFVWLLGHQKNHAGCQAGTLDKEGYRAIQIQRRMYKAHRLAWFYIHGVWPAEEIDHENGKPDDNRACNLRESDRLKNSRNRKLAATNKSGYKGVHWNPSAHRWVASIGFNRKRIYIGAFVDVGETGAAYAAKAKELFGEFVRRAA